MNAQEAQISRSECTHTYIGIEPTQIIARAYECINRAIEICQDGPYIMRGTNNRLISPRFLLCFLHIFFLICTELCLLGTKSSITVPSDTFITDAGGSILSVRRPSSPFLPATTHACALSRRCTASIIAQTTGQTVSICNDYTSIVSKHLNHYFYCNSLTG